jgi:hypothetical protein
LLRPEQQPDHRRKADPDHCVQITKKLCHMLNP